MSLGVFILLLVSLWWSVTASYIFQQSILMLIGVDGTIILIDAFIIIINALQAAIVVLSFGTFHAKYMNLLNLLTYSEVRQLSHDVSLCRHERNSGSLEIASWIKMFRGKDICLLNRYYYDTTLHEPLHALTSTFFDGTAELTNSIYKPHANCRGADNSYTIARLICSILGVYYLVFVFAVLYLCVMVFVCKSFFKVVASIKHLIVQLFESHQL